MNNAVLFYERANLVKRYAHFYAEGFDLIGARDHTAIIAGKDNNRFVPQIGSEDSFAGDEEVIAIT